MITLKRWQSYIRQLSFRKGITSCAWLMWERVMTRRECEANFLESDWGQIQTETECLFSGLKTQQGVLSFYSRFPLELLFKFTACTKLMSTRVLINENNMKICKETLSKRCHERPEDTAAKNCSAILNIKNLTLWVSVVTQKKFLCKPHNTYKHLLKLTVCSRRVLACLSITEFRNLSHGMLNDSEILCLY